MKIKLDVAQLQIGMFVAELDRPWLGSGFAFQGFEIVSQRELDRVKKCADMFI